MATRSEQSDYIEIPLKINERSFQSDPINILLLGQTGVGKTTFINAFANYLVYDHLKEAMNGQMQIVIPFSYSHIDDNTYENIRIFIGQEEFDEHHREIGQSDTQQCRSFVFPIGDRILRFIDTPGIGDTNGINQDEKNFQDILNYISQFEHLQAVLILFKPNEDRLTIPFRYCINELLHHLDESAKENIIFIFTNAQSTFFKPGLTNTILQTLLKEHREKRGVHIPYSIKETFLFDNESFRFLALHANGIEFDEQQLRSSIHSWDRSVKESTRLIEHIITRPVHNLKCILSLNEAEQLVRKLPRPLAETARLIQENIQLAQEYKQKLLDNPQMISQGIPQKEIDPKPIIPQTVCTHSKCCTTIGEGVNQKIEYKSICHEECYVKGVEQEKIADEYIRECQIMDPYEGKCEVCGCDWTFHMHLTYKCETNVTYEKSQEENSIVTVQQTLVEKIDRLVNALQNEQTKIQDVYRKMAQFLSVHSLLPINNDYIEYLRYFIRVERVKHSNNAEVMANLSQIVADYTNEMEAFEKIVREQKLAGQQTSTLTPEEVFQLSRELYQLPINGKLIRAQVNSIQTGQKKTINKREKWIELPGRAARSAVMLRLRGIVSQ